MKNNIEVPVLVNFILQELEKCGYEAYMVGGCVRDCIMMRNPNDYDICTSATPSEILKAFPNERFIPTGLQYGTVTIILDGEPYEITTYRIDGKYSDNYRPDSVEFTTDLIEDLNRRDFTINAMAYNPKSGLIDPFGGVDDIKRKEIKCVGLAKDRFNENASRILRAIRFASQLGFNIVSDTDWEIRRQYKKLDNVSIERINYEFCKIAQYDGFYTQLLLYKDVFSIFVPELKDLVGFQQNNPHHSYDAFEHTVHAIENCDSPDLIVRLAVFFHDFGKPHSFQDGEDGIRHFKGHGRVSADITNEIMKRLRIDNDTRKKIVELVYYHDATFKARKKYLKKWLNKIGGDQFKRLLLVRKADIKGHKQNYEVARIKKIDDIEIMIEEILSEESCFSLKDLAVSGKDLIEIGFMPGKAIGATLQELLDCVIAEEVENNHELLLMMAKNWIP